MKKLIMLLTALTVAFSSVYAEPAETADTGADVQQEQQEAVTPNVEDAALPITDNEIKTFANLKISNDGSAVYTMKEAVDDDSYEQISANIETFNSMYAAEGMQWSAVEEGGKKYIVVTDNKEKGDIITLTGGTSYNGRLAVNRGIFSSEYFAATNLDMRTSTLETPVEDASIYCQLVVELPFPAGYNNANLSENFGTKLTWNIYDGRANPIDLKFTTPNYISLGILLVIIILAVVITFVVKSKKNKPTDAELVENAVEHLEGETDESFTDPFAEENEEFENADNEAEVTEEIAEVAEESATESDDVTEETETSEE